ncbi:MAG: hypothetical protein RL095_2512 [Verrucomicrobiota bacterium]|jgi:hypothetical protein
MIPRFALFALLASCSFTSCASGINEGIPLERLEREDRAGIETYFRQSLQGEAATLPRERTLRAKEVASAQTALWADYKNAAVALGWDKQISAPAAVPPLPSYEEFSKLPRHQRPKIPQFAASSLPCGTENMPYITLTKGQKPAQGWPLFFQTHGGGSTDDKLPGPHAWGPNSQDWQAQVGLALFMLPKDGYYFIPRMANDNKGRWWFKHNHIAFDKLIRHAILFRDVDPDRIYMMGISEGAYGTEALTPFWGDRFAGGCAMAGGAGGGERFYNLRNTAFRNDTGEHDTMYGRRKLAQETHEYLEMLKKDDPQGYDHFLNIQAGKGHGIDYRPGPAWIAGKTRNPRPTKVCWFNFELDGQRRTEFSWLSLAKAPERDTLIIAEIDKAGNRIQISAKITPPDVKNESPVYNTNTPEPVKNRLPLSGNSLFVHLDDKLLDLDKTVTIEVNGKLAFKGKVARQLSFMAADIARHGDPGRVFPGRVEIKL